MKNLAIAYAMKKKAKKMNRGGEMKYCAEGCDMEHMHNYAKGGPVLTKKGYESEMDPHHKEHEDVEMEEMMSGDVSHEGAADRYNHGAMEEDDKMLNQHGDEDGEDMVGRIMKKRQMYAKGGVVANNTHPFEDDFKDDEFDDLVLDDHMEAKQPGSNEHGNEYGADHNDVVSRIMMKRKKQHNPRPA